MADRIRRLWWRVQARFNHIVSCHVISCHIMSYHAISCLYHSAGTEYMFTVNGHRPTNKSNALFIIFLDFLDFLKQNAEPRTVRIIMAPLCRSPLAFSPTFQSPKFSIFSFQFSVFDVEIACVKSQGIHSQNRTMPIISTTTRPWQIPCRGSPPSHPSLLIKTLLDSLPSWSVMVVWVSKKQDLNSCKCLSYPFESASFIIYVQRCKCLQSY